MSFRTYFSLAAAFLIAFGLYPAAARAAICDGFYSAGFTLTEGTQNPSITTPPKPGKGQVQTETPFGTCLTRATDYASEPPDGFARNDYSRRQAFNADSTYYIVYSDGGYWHLYDAKTLKYIRQLTPLAGDAEPQWHSTDPNTLYYIARNGGRQLLKLDVRKNTSSVVADFTGKLPSWAAKAEHISTKSEGSPSADGRYWGFAIMDANFNTLGFMVWDLTSNKLVGSRQANTAIDNVSISASGRWFIINGDGGVWAWSPDFTKKKLLDKASGVHSDLAIGANREDFYVGVDYSSANGDVYATDLDACPSVAASATSAPVCPRNVLFSMYTAGGWVTMHFSGKAFARRGWVLISTYNLGSNTGAKPWFRDKIFAIELTSKPKVYELAFTHRVSNPAGNDANAINYWNEPQASVNRDFTKILFNSNWNDSSATGVDAYMIVLPPGAFGLKASMAGPLPPSLQQGAGIASLQPFQPSDATPPANAGLPTNDATPPADAGLPTVASPRTVSITPPIVSFIRIVKARALVAWRGFIDWIDALYI